MTAVFMACPDCLYDLWFQLAAPPESFRVECPRCGNTFAVSSKVMDVHIQGQSRSETARKENG